MADVHNRRTGHSSVGESRAAGMGVGLAAIALLGNTCFVVSVIVLHILQPDLRPSTDAVSYYVHGRSGWLLTTGLLSWGAGSLALLIGLVKEGRGCKQGVGWWALGVWTFGVVLGGLFAADPAGHWDEPPSISGLIHGNAAMVAFIAFPLSALYLAGRFREDPSWRRVAWAATWLAVAAAVSLAAFFVSLTPVFITHGPPKLLGLTERVLLGVYVAWLSVAAVGLGWRFER